LIQGDCDAQDWPSRDEGGEVVRGLRAAAILETVLAPTELGALGRIDAPEANARAVNLECVAVDDAGLPDQIVGESWRSHRHKETKRKKSASHQIYCPMDCTETCSPKPGAFPTLSRHRASKLSESVDAHTCEFNGSFGLYARTLESSPLESSCADACLGHSSNDFESMGYRRALTNGSPALRLIKGRGGRSGTNG